MKEKFVLDLVKKLIGNSNQLSLSQFNMMTTHLNKNEEKELLDILEKNKISIVEDNNISKSEKIRKISPTIDSKKVNLSNEQLCTMYQNGDEKALELIWVKNLGWINMRIEKYINKYKHKLEREDLEQSCFMGIRKAAEKYNSKYHTKFTTYATFWIDQSITRTIVDTGFTIRIPVHKFDQINRIKGDIIKYNLHEYRKLVEFVKEKEGLNEEQIQEILFLSQYVLDIVSLDMPVGEEKESTIGQILIADKSEQVEEIVIKDILKEEIECILSHLNDQEIKVIQLRFGLHDNEPKTLEEIGKIFGVTRERIRQIESKALRRLRHPTRRKYLKEYWEEM